MKRAEMMRRYWAVRRAQQLAEKEAKEARQMAEALRIAEYFKRLQEAGL